MTDPQPTEEPTAPPLHCCRGEPAPTPVTEGWQNFEAMSTRAQQDFTEVLTRSVVEPDDDVLGQMLAGFCESHGEAAPEAFAALKACQFLLRNAAALDLGVEAFVEDLQALSPEGGGAARILATRFPPLKQRIREGLLLQTLADHGRVLVDLDWRVDRVASSDRVVDLDAPVVFLTLRMRNGDERERLTLQLTPASIQRLQEFCQRFSGG